MEERRRIQSRSQSGLQGGGRGGEGESALRWKTYTVCLFRHLVGGGKSPEERNEEIDGRAKNHRKEQKKAR